MSALRSAAARPLAALLLLTTFGACNDPDSSPAGPDEAVAGQPAASRPPRFYGPAVKIGDGVARTYVLVDQASLDLPLEIGVALSHKALEGLPAAIGAGAMVGGGHGSMNVQLLALPRQNPTPYRFVELDWNPAGHEPPGVYDLPHFDFHFYTIPVAERNAIVPTDPDFGVKAASLPAEALRPPFYLDGATAAGVPAAAVTVPQMGLHWVDVRSPELQGLVGNPAGFRPFTRTFLLGSWDGRFVFAEPMVTRAYLLAKRDPAGGTPQDEIVPLPTAQHYVPAGYYPHAYRVAYDGDAHEFLVGLTQLVAHE